MEKRNLSLILYFVATLWIVFIVDRIIAFDLRSLGIYPRNYHGAIGIILAPFLHANLFHLVSNTMPLLVLGAILGFFYKRITFGVITIIIVVSGILTWLLARTAIHIGASGLIYGIAAFLILFGIQSKKILPFILSLIVLFTYGGSMIFGLLPTNPYISWEGHLFGAIAGVLAARIYQR